MALPKRLTRRTLTRISVYTRYTQLCSRGILISMKTSFSNYKKLLAFSKKHGLVEKTSIILGLSVGPDSVFLLHFLADLHQQGFIRLVAAHLDHQWRAESYKDVALCQTACAQLGIELVTQRVSDLGCPIRYNGSKEDVARQQRRFFFASVRHTHGADYVAVAHHADDQEETFFIRLLRGTSLSGLVGMRPRSEIYIRPLLCLHKREIVEYLDQQHIPYITDATNASDDFLRNRLRNNVLPALKQADSRFTTTFTNTLEQLQATESFLEAYSKQQYALLVEHTATVHTLDIKKFALLDPVIQYRVILHWLRDYQVSFPVRNKFFAEMVQFLLQPQGGTHQIHHDWAIVKKQYRAHIVAR